MEINLSRAEAKAVKETLTDNKKVFEKLIEYIGHYSGIISQEEDSIKIALSNTNNILDNILL